MPSCPLKAAIIGTGRIGSLLERDALRSKPHSHAGWYAAHPRVTLVAGADTNPERLADFGADWQISSEHLYGDHRELLAREKPDLVSICAYATERVEMARAAIEAGACGLWLEKAVACSLAQAADLRELADRAGVAIVVNHMRRADPAWRRVAEIVARGELGRLESVHVRFSGHFLHTGTHAWDALDEWCGPWAEVRCWKEEQERRRAEAQTEAQERGNAEAQAEAQGRRGAEAQTEAQGRRGAEAQTEAQERRSAEAQAEAQRRRSAEAQERDHVVGEYSDWAAVPRGTPQSMEAGSREPEAGSREPSSDPSGLAHIVFENGVHAFVSGSRKRYFTFECDLTFTAGRIQIGNDVQRIWRPAASPRYEGFVELAESEESLAAASPPSILDALLGAIDTGRDRLTSLDDAIRALRFGLGLVYAGRTPGVALKADDLAADFRAESI
jgi:predicted dehydrogenase